MDQSIDVWTKNLSLAISLIDDYSKKQPQGKIEVLMEDKKHKAVKNLSGYYLFLNLPDGDYVVQVRSKIHSDEKIYFDEDVSVSLPFSNPLNPVKEVILKPNPAYPFPFGATLIRGLVLDPDEKAVADATVRVVGKEIETKTTEKGEFVLYFGPLKESEIIEENNKKYVKINGSKIIRIEATDSTGLSGSVEIEVEEATTKIKYMKLS